MGMSLRDLEGMGLQEFGEIVRAWNRTQNPDEPEPMTPQEEDALAAMLGI
ncbi:hypothetical protein [Enterovirga aerilata]|uniref:Uncharacterized protein n=1 Tax=Enterovirga aerilata TaxID=2730920 RepID=A0A849IFX4_9HYPH|nr:hypothetical protein [Enterovirga sp. DB1703]NNM75060.1 hypothetical protein [Enterovirga sp. DB1703]